MKHFQNVITVHVRTRGWLLVMLVLVLTSVGATPGYALPGDPIERTPEEEVEDISVPESYAPPAGGFEWGMPSRFGQYKDGMVDYHWNAATREYDPGHIRPAGGFQVNFYGCATKEDAEATGETTLSYKWQVIGADGAATQTVEGKTCRWSPRFAEGTYKIRLTITPRPTDQPEYYEQEVKVNDLFIVSIGDSYGSGEGNPDIPQKYDAYGFVSAGARWQDKQCHRSAYAGAARAALGIEGSDPKSSVTFISLACSGATINARIYSGDHYEGSGVLDGYRGVDPPNPGDYSPASFLKPQIQALAEAANGREIDALVVSGGGNDMHFADIIADCVWHNMPRVLGTGGRCHEQPEITDRLAEDFELLPDRYVALANAIHHPDPSGRPALSEERVSDGVPRSDSGRRW